MKELNILLLCVFPQCFSSSTWSCVLVADFINTFLLSGDSLIL